MPDGEFPSGMPGLDTLNRSHWARSSWKAQRTPSQQHKRRILLPLWQAIRDGSENGADSDAAVTQIQAQMTEAQLTAIEALGQTFEDLQTWLQEQGIEMQAPTDRQGGGQPPADGQSDIQPPGRGNLRGDKATSPRRMGNLRLMSRTTCSSRPMDKAAPAAAPVEGAAECSAAPPARTADHAAHRAHGGIANCELRIANCELRITNYELRIANREKNCEEF
jgi:hypothetical protein